MIPNCKGCKYEFDEAVRLVEEGFHLATAVDMPGSENLGVRGHFGMIIVDDNGNLVAW